jgi:uncharacterized protein
MLGAATHGYDGAMNIQTLEQLRALYAAPKERAVKKQIAELDAHCRRFIALSPFVVVASGSGAEMDASPRGGAPGFIKTPDAHTLLIPDAPGNNRLDTLENIVAQGHVGLLFMIPGVDETLRVNGRATLATDDALLAMCSDERRRPALVIRVEVAAAYLHCAKAFMRSRLWQPGAQVERTALPSAGEMLSDHTGIRSEPETQEAMRARYAPDL